MTWEAVFWPLAIVVCGLPFLPAVLEWYRRSDAAPLVVVREQDTNISHFAHSFFDRVQDYCAREGLDLRVPPTDFEGEFAPGEPLVFLGRTTTPRWSDGVRAAQVLDQLVIAARDLLLEGGLVYEREVFATGRVYAGAHATFRAVYAGTEISLAEHCTVARWLHAQGHVYVGAHGAIYGRASSRSSITLGEHTLFERLNAPLIRFGSDAPAVPPDAPADRPVHAAEVTWVPAPDHHRMDARTVRIAGDLELAAGSVVHHHLVVRGALTLGAGCRVDGNLKAHRALVLGPGCVVQGALVSRGPLSVGAGSVVTGPLVSESDIELAPGCRIGSAAHPTTVSAPRIRVVPGSEVAGSLWAGASGMVAAAAAPQKRKIHAKS